MCIDRRKPVASECGQLYYPKELRAYSNHTKGIQVEEFISMVTSQLGIGESEAKSATGGVLKVIKDQLGESSFGSVLEKLPGADSLVSEAEAGAAEPSGGGGLMGSLTSMAGSLLGGGGGVADVTQALSSSGIGLDKAGGFLSTLMSFLKDKLGDDMFASVTSNLPDLFGSKD